MTKKVTCLLLAAGLALAGVPAGAQGYGPDTVWGAVPQGVEGIANAVLLDPSGKTVAMVPVTGGRFVFQGVAPGQYTVGLYTASGQQVARACPGQLVGGSAFEAVFTCGPAPAAPVASGGGISTTAWILAGAAAIGITVGIVVATQEDEGPASPIR